MSHDPHDESAVPGGRRPRRVLGFGALRVRAALFPAIAVNASNAATTRRETQTWYFHTFEVLVATEALKSAANKGMRGERGYLITGDTAFLRPHTDSVREGSAALERIDRLTRDNPEQQRNIAELRKRM